MVIQVLSKFWNAGFGGGRDRPPKIFSGSWLSCKVHAFNTLDSNSASGSLALGLWFSVVLWDDMVYRSVDKMRPLTSAFVRNVRHSGRYGPDKYGDQHGLLLRVLPTGGKQWI